MSIVEAAVFVTLFCCIAAVAMFWIDARSSKPSNRKQAPVDPELILGQRYASGEIDEAEYAQRLSTLRVGPPLHAYLDR